MISFSTIYGSKFTPSYGQISLVPDNSLIAQTTDCITSMMTSALIGINSDCTDNLNKINSTYPDKAPDNTTSVSSSSSNNPYNLSKNNPFYHEFQSKNTVDGDVSTPTFTSDSSNTVDGNYMDTFQSPPQDNPSTFLKSPPQDNPSTFSALQQQNMNQPVSQDNPSTFSALQQQNMNPPVSNPYSFQSFHTSINKNIHTNPTNSELGESLDGKNKHSKEIAACFDRAFSIDNYLSDSEIIECAKDRDSFK
ncbi:MAG: hypothetical protein L0H55_12300 [Candidatus Nitrosocosmicus sp.]|nr:hypothetical protein [Candidatus Nitrosocosmicus sp.]